MFLFALAQAGSPGAVETVLATLHGMLTGFLERLPYLVIGVIVLILFWAAGRITMRLLHQAGVRTSLHQNLADLLGRLAQAVAVVLGLLVAAVVVIPTFRPGDLIAGLGITSVAVGFAFKDILQNFFAGILLLWREPFKVGDEIRSGNFEGVVEDINIRSTRLKTYDGERAVRCRTATYSLNQFWSARLTISAACGSRWAWVIRMISRKRASPSSLF